MWKWLRYFIQDKFFSLNVFLKTVYRNYGTRIPNAREPAKGNQPVKTKT